MKNRARRAPRALLLLAPLLLAGCAVEDRQLAADFFLSFFQNRYATPLNLASYAVGKPTGDAEADAALGAADAVQKVKQADELAAQADADTAKGDFKSACSNLNQAVTLRGDDYFLIIRHAGAVLRYSASDAESAFTPILTMTAADPQIKSGQAIAVVTAAIREVERARQDILRWNPNYHADAEREAATLLAEFYTRLYGYYRERGEEVKAADAVKMFKFYAAQRDEMRSEQHK